LISHAIEMPGATRRSAQFDQCLNHRPPRAGDFEACGSRVDSRNKPEGIENA
jgi:hypothetical protein